MVYKRTKPPAKKNSRESLLAFVMFPSFLREASGRTNAGRGLEIHLYIKVYWDAFMLCTGSFQLAAIVSKHRLDSDFARVDCDFFKQWKRLVKQVQPRGRRSNLNIFEFIAIW